MKLIFATNNQHKVQEVLSVIGNAISIEIVTLEEAGIFINIPEPYATLEENAMTKARTIFELTGSPCFGEDTGLETEALHGEPGVLSARYAGDEKSFDRNIEKLLRNLEGKNNRRARFRTVIGLIVDGQELLFEGVCEGVIIQERRGTGGFGYDPIFVPEGAIHTFAEMDQEKKNQYSHRARATEKLAAYLSQYGPSASSG